MKGGPASQSLSKGDRRPWVLIVIPTFSCSHLTEGMTDILYVYGKWKKQRDSMGLVDIDWQQWNVHR